MLIPKDADAAFAAGWFCSFNILLALLSLLTTATLIPQDDAVGGRLIVTILIIQRLLCCAMLIPPHGATAVTAGWLLLCSYYNFVMACCAAVLIVWDVAVAITTGWLLPFWFSFPVAVTARYASPSLKSQDDCCNCRPLIVAILILFIIVCWLTACCAAVLILTLTRCCCHHRQLIAAIISFWSIVATFPGVLARTISDSYGQPLTRAVAEVIARVLVNAISTSSFKSSAAAVHRTTTIVLKEPVTWTFPEAVAKAVAGIFPEAVPKKLSHRTCMKRPKNHNKRHHMFTYLIRFKPPLSNRMNATQSS